MPTTLDDPSVLAVDTLSDDALHKVAEIMGVRLWAVNEITAPVVDDIVQFEALPAGDFTTLDPAAAQPGDERLLPDGRIYKMVAGATDASDPDSWEPDVTRDRIYPDTAARIGRVGFTPEAGETVGISGTSELWRIIDPADATQDMQLGGIPDALSPVPLPADGSTLEVRHWYFGREGSYTIPNGVDGDYLFIENASNLKTENTRALYTGKYAFSSDGTIYTGTLSISPNGRWRLFWDGALDAGAGAWRIHSNRPLQIELGFQDDGLLMTRGSSYLVYNSTANPLTFKVPQAPGGRIDIRYDSRSTGAIILEMEDPLQTPNLSQGLIVGTDFTYGPELKGAKIEIEGGSNNYWSIYVSEANNLSGSTIPFWLPNQTGVDQYTAGQVVQYQEAGQPITFYSRIADGASGAAFDPLLWQNVGEVPIDLPILSHFELQVVSHNSATTELTGLVFTDLAGNNYNMEEWVVAADSMNLIPVGTSVVGQDLGSPTADVIRTLTLAYNGAVMRGIMNIGFTPKVGEFSTSVTLKSHYLDGTTDVYIGSAVDAASLWPVNQANGFDYYTQPPIPDPDQLVVLPGDGNAQSVNRRNLFYTDQTVGAAPDATEFAYYELGIIQSDEASYVAGTTPVEITRFSAVEDAANPGTYTWQPEIPASTTELWQDLTTAEIPGPGKYRITAETPAGPYTIAAQTADAAGTEIQIDNQTDQTVVLTPGQDAINHIGDPALQWAIPAHELFAAQIQDDGVDGIRIHQFPFSAPALTLASTAGSQGEFLVPVSQSESIDIIATVTGICSVEVSCEHRPAGGTVVDVQDQIAVLVDGVQIEIQTSNVYRYNYTSAANSGTSVKWMATGQYYFSVPVTSGQILTIRGTNNQVSESGQSWGSSRLRCKYNATYLSEARDIVGTEAALVQTMAAPAADEVVSTAALETYINDRIVALDFNKQIGTVTVATWDDATLPIAEENHFFMVQDTGIAPLVLGNTDVKLQRGDRIQANVDGTTAGTIADWTHIPGTPSGTDAFNLKYYFGVQQLEAAGEENEGLGNIAVLGEFPTDASTGEALTVRETGMATVNGVSHQVVEGDVWIEQGVNESINWQRVVVGSPFADYKSFRGNGPAFTTSSGITVLSEIYDPVLIPPDAAGGEIPMRLDFTATSEYYEALLGPLAVFNETFFFAERSTAREFVIRWDYAGDYQLVLVNLNDAKCAWLSYVGSGDADSSVVANGTTMVSYPSYIQTPDPDRVALTPVPGGYLLDMVVLPSTAFLGNPVTFEMNPVGSAGIIEFAFSRRNIIGGAQFTRYDVTVNGLLYTNTPESGHAGANDIGWTDYAVDVPAGNAIDSITVDTGGAQARVKPNTSNTVQVKSAGAACEITVTFAAVATFTLTQTILTDATGSTDGTDYALGDIPPTGGVITIPNAPAGEAISQIVFHAAGTSNVIVGSDTWWQRLTYDTFFIRGMDQDADVQVTTATVLAPELRINKDAVSWIHSGGSSTQGPVVTTADDMSAWTGYLQSQVLSCTPGEEVVITVSPTAHTNNSGTNATVGFIAFDAATDLPITPTAAAIAGARQPYCSMIRGRNNLQYNNTPERGAMPLAVVKIPAAPASGQYYLRQYPYNFASLTADHDLPLLYIERTENVTIAAVNQIMVSRILTVTGATVGADQNLRISDTEVTVVEGYSNEVRLDLTAGKLIDIANTTSTDCTFSEMVTVNEGSAVLNIVPTGPNPTLTVGEKDPVVVDNRLVHLHQYNAGISTNFGDLSFYFASSGIRQIFVRAANAAVHGTWHFYNYWNGSTSDYNYRSVNLTGSWVHPHPNYHFTAAGHTHFARLEHVATGEVYDCEIKVGAGYNNNIFYLRRYTNP